MFSCLRQARAAVLALVCVALLASTASVADAQPTRESVRADRVDDNRVRPVVRPVEELRLSCNADVVGDQRGVLCRWSEADNPNTRGYRLYRIVNGSPRELISTVGNDGRFGYFDTDLEAPSKLVYGVVAANRSGRVIGIGGPAHVSLGDHAERPGR